MDYRRYGLEHLVFILGHLAILLTLYLYCRPNVWPQPWSRGQRFDLDFSLGLVTLTSALVSTFYT